MKTRRRRTRERRLRNKYWRELSPYIKRWQPREAGKRAGRKS